MSDIRALIFAYALTAIAVRILWVVLRAVEHHWPLWLPVEPLVYGALGAWMVYSFIAIWRGERV